MIDNEKQTNSEDALIRSALNRMQVPIDRDRAKRAFVGRALQGYGSTRRRIGFWSFRWAPGVAVCYAALAGLYLWAAFSSSAIDGVRGESAKDWRGLYQGALGNPVAYRQGDELRLSDGSTVVCLKDSIVGVVYTLKERRIALRRGTVEIEAARNTNLPMVVNSGAAEIRVTGTRFVVSTDELYEVRKEKS